jgi:hypothetical protein
LVALPLCLPIMNQACTCIIHLFNIGTNPAPHSLSALCSSALFSLFPPPPLGPLPSGRAERLPC